LSPYALQKVVGEQYLQMFTRLYGFETVTIRYFNVFGPRQDPGSEYSAVIPRFVTALRDGGRPTVFGDGEQTRDFTFVANVVQANRRACTAPAPALGLAYNVACEERISLNGLLDVLGELMGKRADPLYAAARPGDIKHSLADISRARTLLGYAPEITLREGLRRTLESF
jgi:nucleoside-diphosphate-sugar epimerase